MINNANTCPVSSVCNTPSAATPGCSKTALLATYLDIVTAASITAVNINSNDINTVITFRRANAP